MLFWGQPMARSARFYVRFWLKADIRLTVSGKPTWHSRGSGPLFLGGRASEFSWHCPKVGPVAHLSFHNPKQFLWSGKSKFCTPGVPPGLFGVRKKPGTLRFPVSLTGRLHVWETSDPSNMRDRPVFRALRPKMRGRLDDGNRPQSYRCPRNSKKPTALHRANHDLKIRLLMGYSTAKASREPCKKRMA